MNLTTHQRALAFGALYYDEMALNAYQFDKNHRERRLEKVIEKDSELECLINRFKEDQKNILALLRRNMMNIMLDQRLTSFERSTRLERYWPDYFAFMILLDRRAFPSSNGQVYNHVPEYIPDRLSDMGIDPRINQNLRINREKIEVRKKDIFEKAKSLFFEVYKTGRWNKEEFVDKIATWIYKNVEYDFDNMYKGFGKGSITLDELKKGVCRHHALYAQVLNQAFGLTSRLLKCEYNGIPHAANLVRVNGMWNLLDVTNPVTVGGEEYTCFFPIAERSIDLNRDSYDWTVVDDQGVRNYKSRNNMCFRIK